jgi:xanthine dehydrogenase YagS FAD-binding subunit
VRAFELRQATSVEDAVGLLAKHGTGARALGGGTDLVAGIMRDQVIGAGMPYPSLVVDITRVPGMTGITLRPDGALIGAATTLAEIAESPALRKIWPLLTTAAGEVASPEIRAIGTLGGNLHQRPRCWFFRNKDFDCIKKGGDICFAVKGDNRYNAILGGNVCFIVHPSDLATALVALGGRARVASAGGDRVIELADYFVGPDEDLLRESVLRPDELLVDVFIPTPPPASRQGWQKMNEKDAPTWDFALASVALTVTAEGGVWRDGRMVLGGVAPIPYRATVIEEALAGRDIRTALPDAIAALRDVARPMRDNGYKVDLIEYLIERVTLRALDEEPIGTAAAFSAPAG